MSIEDNGLQPRKTASSLMKVSEYTSFEQFARAMTHDLRNPLSIIIGCADILSNDREKLSDSTMDSIVNKIMSASDQLNDLLKDIVQFAKIIDKETSR